MHSFFLNCFLIMVLIIGFSACDQASSSAPYGLTDNTVLSLRDLPSEFQEYWYSGQAEVTSYELVQERYGELREGTAVTIFVTEDFNPEKQVKADGRGSENISVLKLNLTKKFITGIYPYSIMNSSFQPVQRHGHALKLTHSMQEWCGQGFAQLNNREEFEIDSYSYFESESDQAITLPKVWLESELWNLMRINPGELPQGDIDAIPSFEFLRMYHRPIKTYRAKTQMDTAQGMMRYTIRFPELKHAMSWYVNGSFPYEIIGWDEENPNGLKTRAIRKKKLKTAYWNLNQNADQVWRDSLAL
ncbi:septum formation inhibitor Maf [Aureitalea marina]|uniref:Septum formation inhibitor Maf n=1 Tax=Aureitalea marina TaxID=930804 RepID=A0A2S7KPG4_9FLAO|nr:septum formation inhibitor Maf [Aureitalea marina]PQB04524.1 hypothetical protein BST85_06125 [Aureitalea marina]